MMFRCVPLICITLNHTSLSAPIYVVNDLVPCTRDGHDFAALPFRMVWPNARADALPTATIELDNVDRSIGLAVLGLPSRPSVTVEVVRIKDKLSIERGPFTFKLVSASITRLVVSGQLAMPAWMMEPYPGNTYNPASHPQLFDK